jgi:hypothetical protein
MRPCADLDIKHRLMTPMHPSANGQVERMSQTIKEANIKRCNYHDHALFTNHVDHFIAVYNFGRRLKTMKGLTPYEYICKQWTNDPERFRFNPLHQMQLSGLNI